MKRLCTAFILLTALAFAGIRIEVKNGGHLRFQEVVDVRMTAEQYKKYKDLTLNEIDSSGLITEVPSAWSVDEWDGGEKEYVLSILLTGLTQPNVTRTFEFGKFGNVPFSTDLHFGSINDSGFYIADESFMRIINQYFSVVHKTKGGGGCFSNVHFVSSDTDDKDLVLLDRCFTQDIGNYFIKEDKEATAKIISANRLRVVVESRSHYANGDKAAPGNLYAVYHYVYHAFSPVVTVSAKITKDDDIDWNELHFMHLTSMVRKYDRFVYGNQGRVDVHEFLPKGAKSFGSIDATDWCVMEDAKNAVGVGGITLAWDASSDFYDFIKCHSVQNFKNPLKGVDVMAKVYFGPASSDRTVYAKWLAPLEQPTVTVIADVPSLTAPGEFKGEHILDDKMLSLAFSGAADGFACVGIKLYSLSPVFCNAKGARRPMWELHFRKGTDAATEVAVSAADVPPEQTSVERIENGLKFVWKGVRIGDSGTFDAIAKVILKYYRSEWTLEVDNHSKEYGLWDSEFPILSNIVTSGTADALVPTGNWGGTLYHKYMGNFSGNYPSYNASLQMMALMRDGYGLYYGVHDGGARPKDICMRTGSEMFTRVWAENMGVPGSGKKADFPVVVSVFQPDWWEAAKIYRLWALKQPWTARGPIKDDPTYPKKLTDLGFWFLLGSDNDKEVESVVGDTMDRAFAKATVPTGVHWYNWHQIPFDNSYPEYFPIKNGVKEATERMTKRGQVVMPYINGRLWDTGIESFNSAKSFTCKNLDGENYIEEYGSHRKLAPMCPYTQLWQDKINEICLRMRDDVGVNAIYIDQIGSAAPQLCFDPSHGHPLGGGTHWVDGYRKMLSRVRSMAAEKGLFITTENTAEPYMDNVHAFLTWSQNNDTDVPLLPAVYSGYTTYFSSPQAESDSLVAFRAAQGRDFMFGCQIGWHSFDILKDEHKEKFDFSMRLAELRLATKEFMVFGELVREIKPFNAVPKLTVTLGRRNPHSFTVPAVQGYEWADAKGNRCLYFINYSDSLQKFLYRLPEISRPCNLLRRVTSSGRVPMAVAYCGEGRVDYLEPGEILAIIVEPVTNSSEIEKEDGTRSYHDGIGNYPCLKSDSSIAEEARNYLGNGNDPLLRKAAVELLFRQRGITIDINDGGIPASRNIISVEGESQPIRYTIYNTSEKRNKLKIEWPDGRTEEVVVEKGKISGEKEFGRSHAWIRNSVKFSLEGVDGTMEIPFNRVFRNAVHLEMDFPESVYAGEDFMISVMARKYISSENSVFVQLQFPEGWIVEPPPLIEMENNPAGARKTVVFKCRAPVSTQTKDLNITSMILMGRKLHPITIKRTRPTAQAAKAKSITIDGKLDDWADIPPIAVNEQTPDCIKYGGSKYNGADDCSADLRFAWDEKFLYIAAKVKDDKHLQKWRDGSLWSGDCIQFAMVEGGPLPPSRAQDVSMLREFAIAVDDNGPYVFNWCTREPALMENPNIAAVVGDGEIIYEAAVPWEDINLSKPLSGKKLGLSFVVADNDGDNLRGWLEWTPGIFGYKDGSEYGTLTLE